MNKFILQNLDLDEQRVLEQRTLHAQEGYINKHLVQEALLTLCPELDHDQLDNIFFADDGEYKLTKTENCWTFWAESQIIMITKA